MLIDGKTEVVIYIFFLIFLSWDRVLLCMHLEWAMPVDGREGYIYVQMQSLKLNRNGDRHGRKTDSDTEREEIRR